MGNTRREFSPEYKDEAVKLVINTGRPVATVARELGVKEQTLGRRRQPGPGRAVRFPTPAGAYLLVAHRVRGPVRRPGPARRRTVGRRAADVVDWLNAPRSPAFRAGITHVAIDPAAAYAGAVRQALPDAVVVLDHFHLVQLANTMVTDVRRRLTRDTRGRRGQDRPRVDQPQAPAHRPGTTVQQWFGPGVERRPGRRPDRGATHGLHHQRRATRPARPSQNGRAPPPDPGPPGPLLHLVRGLRHPRSDPARSHHRDLVASGRSVPDHRDHQRQNREYKPGGQGRRPTSLRLPQPRQPPTPRTVALHPRITPGASKCRAAAPPRSRSRVNTSRRPVWAHLVMARILPFVVTFWIAWVGVLTVFYFFDLPMRPGNGLLISQ